MDNEQSNCTHCWRLEWCARINRVYEDYFITMERLAIQEAAKGKQVDPEAIRRLVRSTRDAVDVCAQELEQERSE